MGRRGAAAPMVALVLVLAAAPCAALVRVDLPDHGAEVLLLSREAAFGTELPRAGVAGQLELASPLDACGPLRNQTVAGSIALVRAGVTEGDPAPADRCSYSDKVRRAEEAGFAGAIVYDDVEGRDLVRMPFSGGSPIRIPAVFIGEGDGSSLRRRLPASLRVTLLPDLILHWPWHSLYIAFLVILATCACLTCIRLVCFFYCFRRNRDARAGDAGAGSGLFASPTDLGSLPVRIVQADDEPGEDVCCICLGEYQPNDKVLRLPCRHEFHKGCIHPWLAQCRRVCPICKRDPFSSETTPLIQV